MHAVCRVRLEAEAVPLRDAADRGPVPAAKVRGRVDGGLRHRRGRGAEALAAGPPQTGGGRLRHALLEGRAVGDDVVDARAGVDVAQVGALAPAGEAVPRLGVHLREDVGPGRRAGAALRRPRHEVPEPRHALGLAGVHALAPGGQVPRRDLRALAEVPHWHPLARPVLEGAQAVAGRRCPPGTVLGGRVVERLPLVGPGRGRGGHLQEAGRVDPEEAAAGFLVEGAVREVEVPAEEHAPPRGPQLAHALPEGLEEAALQREPLGRAALATLAP